MAKAASNTISAFAYLMAPETYQPAGVYAVAGDDGFLSHEVRGALVKQLATSGDESLGYKSYDGRVAELRDVTDSLRERSLFGSDSRVVIVEEADAFVKRFRPKLEDYVERPVSDSALVLEVKTWPSNTRLAKALAKNGLTIRCQVPQKGRELTEFTKQLKDWLIHTVRDQADVELKRPAVDLLLDLLPTEVGILYQEALKLSLLVDPAGAIDVELVRDHVGSWRTRKTWDMIDAAAEGRAADALDQLGRLLAAGEDPHALLPQMAATFRRFAASARAFELAESRRQRISLRAALEKSGVPPFKLSDAERQLRQIGRPRAKQLYRDLLAADLQLKGYNSTKDRARRVLETLLIKLSRQAAPAATD